LISAAPPNPQVFPIAAFSRKPPCRYHLVDDEVPLRPPLSRSSRRTLVHLTDANRLIRSARARAKAVAAA